MEFLDAVAARYSAYSLDDGIEEAGVSFDDVVETVRRIAPAVPSSYNSQTCRLIVLGGDDHRAFWSIVADVLRAKVDDEERFARTEAKLKGFSDAAGTILFYEDDAGTGALIEKHPSYEDAFPVWAEHGDAMMQYAVWTGLYDMGLAANIQHYNPIIDDRVGEAFGVPEGLRLVCQMVFGRPTGDRPVKRRLSGEDMVSVGHAKRDIE
ncbi:MAG: hypothetical protein A3208_02180 [Candidatus Methanoprimaticola hominis]|nr:MAG: hypothetical protein A3208_02180 [Methanomassiliicoccales archaeon Mx-06]